MSPSHRIIIFLLFILITTSPAWGEKPAPQTRDDGHYLIRFYQTHLSVVDGDRCTMTPSCSTYALEAVKSHGALMGWFMACERLLRCGGSELHMSPTVNVDGHHYVVDPVSANDFWWSDSDFPGEKSHEKN